jgi:TonB family protein
MKFIALIVTLILILQISSASTALTNDQPTVVTAVAPVFPPIAQAANVGGDVLVEVKINSDGAVTSAKAISNYKLLRAAAEDAAKRWRFNPSAEKSDEHTATLTFTFQVMPRCSPSNELTSIFYPPYKIEARVEKPTVICDDCSPAEREKLKCKNQ